MKTDNATICPECRREVKVRRNRFGDRVYPHHKLATAWTKSGMPSQSVKDDLGQPHNAAVPYTHELDCPMSGQVVEESK